MAGKPGSPGATAGDRDRDRQLLHRVARGELAALRALYDEHGGRAMAIALRILKNPTEAEDVVQETFLEIWKRAADFDAARGGAIAWVATIARSRAIDRLRAGGSAARAVESAAGDLAPPPAPDPRDEAARRQAGDRIRRALERLPAAQREAIELAYFDGLSQSEIARKTGDPLGTVKMRMRLGLGKLCDLLRDHREKPE